ncbi:hypothetical protein TW85_16430 [Marinomonas sp. S3726]|uniref:tyrosine-type recombinase/integrase n=1 Tax=Marinomonas sp. S3726 TaxID=579484 RepID=UPI0005FA5DF9|nr:integrase family protein [Marinomonas sp. S3726]KJZ11958.1 hypothetical protein TW85_16430 [Marinomonas sp. S3726]
MDVKFTKEAINSLEAIDKRIRVKDTKIDGLLIEVLPSGRKSFRVYKRVKGKNAPVSVTLGQFPAVSIENARKKALAVLDKLAHGINPNVQARIEAKSKITLLEVYQDYISQKELTTSSLRGYDQIMRTYLDDWKSKPIADITETQIKDRHAFLTESSKAQADYCMRVLRALFNFAKFEYKNAQDRPIFLYNPVEILSHRKQWNHVARKQTRITKSQIKPLLTGLDKIRSESDCFMRAVCDFVEMALFTGLRKTELLSLQWKTVSLKERSFYVEETKNGSPLELPISDHLLSIFKRRQAETNNEYVFQADNEHGYIREPKKCIARIVNETGIQFTLHDLRRTFTSTAELLRVGTYTIKRLLNHKTQRNDVTAGYTVLTAEELREPSQAIEDSLLNGPKRDKEKNAEVDIRELLSQMSPEEKLALIKSF